MEQMFGEDNRRITMEEVKYHKYCLRCGRLLKKDENKLRGYGQICWKKLKKERRKKLW